MWPFTRTRLVNWAVTETLKSWEMPEHINKTYVAWAMDDDYEPPEHKELWIRELKVVKRKADYAWAMGQETKRLNKLTATPLEDLAEEDIDWMLEQYLFSMGPYCNEWEYETLVEWKRRKHAWEKKKCL